MYTPGNVGGQRPDRATIVYTSKLKALFPGVPIVLGGVEASLRRFAHYDYWDDKVRRPLLFDAKADYLTYGMSEKGILALARNLRMNSRFLRERIGTETSVSGPNDSPIIPIIIGDSNKTVEASDKLFAQGFLLSAIRPPTVPEGTARLRLTVTALHTKEDLECLASSLRALTPA